MSNFSTFKNLQVPEIPIGSIVYHSPFHNKAGCVETGRVYLQSEYPSLFSIIGSLNTYAYTPVSGTPEFDLTWTGTNLVGIGRNSVHRSTNGISWTTTTNIYIPQISCITNGNGVVIAGSPFTLYAQVLARSTDDGLTWKSSLLCGGIRQIVYFNSKYFFLKFAGGDSQTYGGIFANADNATGGNGTESGQGNQYFNGVVVGSQLTVCGTGGKIRTTTDGVTWTARTSGTAQDIIALLYANSLYVYSGNAGVLATSTDAITWTARTSGTTSGIYGLAYGNGVYVYSGTGGVLRTSTDAITWTARTSGVTAEIRRVIFANGIFTYATSGGGIATSTDGITWTPRTSGTTSSINALVYQNGLYLYGTLNGGLSTSTDAITWTARTSNSTGDIYEIFWDGSRYVTNGDQISTSTDGVTWTNIWRGPIGTTALEALAYSPTLGMFAGIGYNGFIITSSDNGLNWVRRTNPSTARFDFIAWISQLSMFVATGASAAIVTSTDGITWTQRSVSASAGQLGTAVWTGTYLAVSCASNNRIVRSTDGINYTFETVVAKSLDGTVVNFVNGWFLSNNTVTISMPASSSFAYTSPNNDLVNWTQRPLPSISGNSTSVATYIPSLNRMIFRNHRTDNGVSAEYSTQYNTATEFIVPNYTIGSGTTAYKTWIKT